jgi:hypothetical protein
VARALTHSTPKATYDSATLAFSLWFRISSFLTPPAGAPPPPGKSSESHVPDDDDSRPSACGTGQSLCNVLFATPTGAEMAMRWALGATEP